MSWLRAASKNTSEVTSTLARFGNFICLAKIVEQDGKYCVVTEKTGRKIGCYPSKEKAEKRLQQVEMFKHMKKDKKSSLQKLATNDEIVDTLAELIQALPEAEFVTSPWNEPVLEIAMEKACECVQPTLDVVAARIKRARGKYCVFTDDNDFVVCYPDRASAANHAHEMERSNWFKRAYDWVQRKRDRKRGRKSGRDSQLDRVGGLVEELDALLQDFDVAEVAMQGILNPAALQTAANKKWDTYKDVGKEKARILERLEELDSALYWAHDADKEKISAEIDELTNELSSLKQAGHGLSNVLQKVATEELPLKRDTPYVDPAKDGLNKPEKYPPDYQWKGFDTKPKQMNQKNKSVIEKYELHDYSDTAGYAPSGKCNNDDPTAPYDRNLGYSPGLAGEYWMAALFTNELTTRTAEDEEEKYGAPEQPLPVSEEDLYQFQKYLEQENAKARKELEANPDWEKEQQVAFLLDKQLAQAQWLEEQGREVPAYLEANIATL